MCLNLVRGRPPASRGGPPPPASCSRRRSRCETLMSSRPRNSSVDSHSGSSAPLHSDTAAPCAHRDDLPQTQDLLGCGHQFIQGPLETPVRVGQFALGLDQIVHEAQQRRLGGLREDPGLHPRSGRGPFRCGAARTRDPAALPAAPWRDRIRRGPSLALRWQRIERCVRLGAGDQLRPAPTLDAVAEDALERSVPADQPSLRVELGHADPAALPDDFRQARGMGESRQRVRWLGIDDGGFGLIQGGGPCHAVPAGPFGGVEPLTSARASRSSAVSAPRSSATPKLAVTDRPNFGGRRAASVARARSAQRAAPSRSVRGRTATNSSPP